VDASSRLWISSASAGLSVIGDLASSSPRFDRYTTADGLSSNNIQCITDDSLGRIYLGTSRGVDRFDPVTRRVKHFTTTDGLATDYVTAALRDSRGALWFGTNDGISRLIPRLDAPALAPPIWIGEVRAGGTIQSIPDLGAMALGNLTLRPDQNHVQIAYFGSGFGTGGPLRYRYRLDGAETAWNGPTDRRVVHYASLAPGRYRFIVEAVNVDGIASERPATVSFAVLAPLWQRWWFVSLGMLLLTATAYSWHRFRVARLVEVERVRARIAADLHDDIGGSLSRIAIQSEVARREVAAAAPPSARRLDDIGETARSVVESLSDVVWSVDPGHDDLASVERRVQEHAADVLGARGVRWTVHATGHRDRVVLDPEARHDLLLLLKEGITNVARHADASVASLNLQFVGSNLHADLRDDGRGFDVSALGGNGKSAGHGLANMRLRARQLGGLLEIASTSGAGTHLQLTIPLKARRRMNMRLWRHGRSRSTPSPRP
jgi:signal transduction histidine kinase